MLEERKETRLGGVSKSEGGTGIKLFDERKTRRLEIIPDSEISARQYNLIMGAVIAWGFLVNYATVSLIGTPEFIYNAPILGIFIGYIVCVLAGTLMAAKSSNPVISFIGFNLVVLPIGVLLALVLPNIPPEIIGKAFLLTGLVTVGMLAVSTAFPDTFLKMGRALFVSLLIGLVVEVIASFIGYRGELFDLFFVGLFSLYIGYDWSKSQMYPKTVDNAVDSALDLYVDLINLFIRILSILSKKN